MSQKTVFAAQERSLASVDKVWIDTTKGRCPVERGDFAAIALRYKHCWIAAEADKDATRCQILDQNIFYATAGRKTVTDDPLCAALRKGQERKP